LDFLGRNLYIPLVLAIKVLDIFVLVGVAILLGYGICSGRDASNG
jgi:hypothetical protein